MLKVKRRFELAGGVWREQPKIRTGLGRLLLLAALLAVVWWLAGLSRAPTEVDVVQAVQRDVPLFISGMGSVKAYNTVTLHTQVDGQLLEVGFEEGQDVQPGDVLAKIDPRPFQSRLDQATANKAQDEAQVKFIQHQLRTPEVRKADAPRREALAASLRQFEATVQSDQVAMDSATAALAGTVITSPIAGRTGIKRVDTGNMVQASDPDGLVDIIQMQPIAVIFSLPQQELPRLGRQLKDDQSVAVRAVDVGSQDILDSGELEMADNQVDEQTGSVRLKAVFPNAGNTLWPGAIVNVKLQVGTQKNAVVVPASSLVHEGGNDYVYVLPREAGKVEARAVKAVLAGDDNAIIAQGVQAGEQVVVQSAGHLQDGSPVTARLVPLPQP